MRVMGAMDLPVGRLLDDDICKAKDKSLSIITPKSFI